MTKTKGLYIRIDADELTRFNNAVKNFNDRINKTAKETLGHDVGTFATKSDIIRMLLNDWINRYKEV